MSRPKRVAIEVEGLTIEGDLDHVVEVVEGLRKKRRWMELQPTKEDLLREDGMVIEAVEPSVRIPPSPEEIKKWVTAQPKMEHSVETTVRHFFGPDVPARHRGPQGHAVRLIADRLRNIVRPAIEKELGISFKRRPGNRAKSQPDVHYVER